MRNIFLLYCVALAGLCACESEEKVYPDGPGLNEVGMQIVLTDPELNDLLNPESPSFLGEEYTKGILVMYLNAGKKTLCQFVPQYTNEGGTQKEWNMIYPPYEDYERDGRVKKNTKGYYYLPFPFNKTEENQDVTILSLRLNGEEASWHQKGDALILDEPITKKTNFIELLAVLDGKKIVKMPVWTIE